MPAYTQPETDSEDELPPGWEERATLEGEVYYANHNLKCTQWSHPRTGRKKHVAGSLPFGWERQILPDGKVIYVDHENETTTYTDPRLAFAVEVTDKNGADVHETFRQRFDASTSALQILHGLDLSTRVAVVTGANSGIGFEIARSLALHGCTVIFACRDLAKAEAAMGRIRAERAHVRCEAMALDLASLASVRKFASEFSSMHASLDVLVLNAGVYGLDFSQTEDGLETMFQVNYLSHFYLAHLLRSSLAKSTMKKLIVVTGEANRFSTVDHTTDIKSHLLSPPARDCFTSTYAYNNSKLFSLMFALEAHRRWHDGAGSVKDQVRVIAVHPGNAVATDLLRHTWLLRLLVNVVRPFAKSTQQAASPAVFSAVAPEMGTTSGLYVNNCFPSQPAEVALNELQRKSLWQLSTQMLLDRLSARFNCSVKSLLDL